MFSNPPLKVMERPEPPTREAIEREKQRQLDLVRDVRRRLVVGASSAEQHLVAAG